MRNSRQAMVGLLAGGALAALALSGGAGAQDGPPRTLRIAVVDMSDCMVKEKSEHAKDLLGQLEAMNKDIKDELGKIRKNADDLRGKLKALEEGSPLWMKLATELNMEEARYKVVGEMSQRRLVLSQNAFRTELYSEARKMVSLVAQEMKIDLVLRADEGAFEEEKSDLALQKNMLRAVLYHDPALDITGKVLARLNEDYKKKKK
jgi:Skp family chaperone for outer membrane proteins